MTAHALSEDAVIAYPDNELVRLIYEHVGQVDDDERDTREALYWLVTELIERLAPALEWAEHVRYYRDEYDPGGVSVVAELAATREAMRRRQGARLIKRALEEG